jgi:hypothetical protein
MAKKEEERKSKKNEPSRGGIYGNLTSAEDKIFAG